MKVYEMSEEYKKQYPTLDIKKDGATYHLYLNGVELKTVTSFNLQVNAGEAAQLTLTMDVFYKTIVHHYWVAVFIAISIKAVIVGTASFFNLSLILFHVVSVRIYLRNSCAFGVRHEMFIPP